MVKSGVSKKQSKAFGSARPTGSETTIKDQTPSKASSNIIAIFEDYPSYNDAIRLMFKFLPKHPLYGAFNSFTEVVLLPTLFKCTFYAFCPSHNLQVMYLNLVDDSLVVLTKNKLLEAISLRVLPSIKFCSPSLNDVISTLYQMGYRKKLKGIKELKKNQFPMVWQFVCHFVIISLSSRIGGINNMGIKLLEIVWSFFTSNAVN